MGKTCPMYRSFCLDHNFCHGAEAEELRAGLEKMIAAADMGDREKVHISSLRRLLDRVDARDSLAYLESIKKPAPRPRRRARKGGR